jgi:hypothetical protein
MRKSNIALIIITGILNIVSEVIHSFVKIFNSIHFFIFTISNQESVLILSNNPFSNLSTNHLINSYIYGNNIKNAINIMNFRRNFLNRSLSAHIHFLNNTYKSIRASIQQANAFTIPYTVFVLYISFMVEYGASGNLSIVLFPKLTALVNHAKSPIKLFLNQTFIESIFLPAKPKLQEFLLYDLYSASKSSSIQVMTLSDFNHQQSSHVVISTILLDSQSHNSLFESFNTFFFSDNIKYSVHET